MNWKRILSWVAGSLVVASVAYAAVGWKVDGYGNIVAGRSSVIVSEGQALNCRLSVAGSTLSVVGSDGNALSPTNPCVVGIRSNTAATVEAASFTSPVSVTFGAASDTDGNLFGITDVNWADRMLFFLSVVTDGSDNYFLIGRRPRESTGTGATDLCQKADEDCDAPNDQMILATGLTLANWTSKYETAVGIFDATYATAGMAWTYSLTSDFIEGFTRDGYLGLRYVFVSGQNGANVNYHWSGTTPPTWNTPANIHYHYWFDSPKTMCVRMTTSAAGNCTNGSGSNYISLKVPLAVVFPTATGTWIPIGTYQASGAEVGTLHGYIDATAETSIKLYRWQLGVLNANVFSGAGDDLYVGFCYNLQ